MSKKLRLISYKVCPFVQSSLIVLHEKNIDCEVSYVDLQNKPDWFLALSPTGKVPVLQIDDNVIFESTVINELLDEISPNPLLLKDPVQRALNRAWALYASNVIVSQYHFFNAEDFEAFKQHKNKFNSVLAHLEQNMKQAPYFNGVDFSLVDCAYAPVFLKWHIIGKKYPLEFLNTYPKIQKWSECLLRRDSVKSIYTAKFEKLVLERLEKFNVYFIEGK